MAGNSNPFPLGSGRRLEQRAGKNPSTALTLDAFSRIFAAAILALLLWSSVFWALR